MLASRLATACAVCDGAIPQGQRRLETWQYLGRYDRAYRRGLVALHWDCFVLWDKRVEFSKSYVEHRTGDLESAQEAVTIHDDQQSRALLLPLLSERRSDQAVELSPRPLVRVYLKHILNERLVQVERWTDWVFSTGRGQTPLETAAWQQAMQALRARFPTSRSLLDGVDLSGLVARRQQMLARYVQGGSQEFEELRRLRREVAWYNEDFHRVAGSAAPCPYCHGKELRYIDQRSSTSTRSCFLCEACGRASHLEDFSGY